MARRRRADASVPSSPTDWSLLADAADSRTAVRRRALGRVIDRYTPAMRAHLVRSKGLAPELADEVLQSFVAERILERGLVAHADASRGRFRAFLLTCLTNHLTDWRRSEARRRWDPLASDADEPPADDARGSGDAFHVEWTRLTIDEALARTERELREAGSTPLWHLFVDRVVDRWLHGRQPPPYRELVAKYGFASPGQAQNRLTTAKRTFRRHLRGVLAEYAADGIDEELASLGHILERGGRS